MKEGIALVFVTVAYGLIMFYEGFLLAEKQVETVYVDQLKQECEEAGGEYRTFWDFNSTDCEANWACSGEPSSAVCTLPEKELWSKEIE